MIRPWEVFTIGSLPAIMVGSVREPPTVGSFSHVQLWRPPTRVQVRAQVNFMKVLCDQSAEVRLGFVLAALANNDGIVGPTDLTITPSAESEMRSETNVAQVAVFQALFNVWCPGQVWVDLPYMQMGSADGIQLNPIVTGVGISIYAQWCEMDDFDPTGQV